MRQQQDMYCKPHERLLKKKPMVMTVTIKPTLKKKKKLMKKNNKQLIQRKLLYGEAIQEKLNFNLKHRTTKKKKFAYAPSILGNKNIFKKYK